MGVWCEVVFICFVEYGQQDGGDLGCVVVVDFKFLYEFFEEDVDGFGEGVGEVGDDEVVEEYGLVLVVVGGFDVCGVFVYYGFFYG